MMKKKILFFVLAAMMLFCVTAYASVGVGDTIEFGGYDWQVLDVRDGKVLVITVNTVMEGYFVSADSDIQQLSWETSRWRVRLNDEFYNSFSENDRAMILETTVVNSYGRHAADDTLDKIFLLSADEAERYFNNDSARRARNLNGARQEWWLRTYAGFTTYMAIVDRSGSVDDSGKGGNFYSLGVRPAMWLDGSRLGTQDVARYAGRADSERSNLKFTEFMTNLWQDLEARFGLFGLFIPMIVIFFAIVLFYVIVVWTYGRFLRKKYNYRMFVNWPGLFILGSYAVAFTIFRIMEQADTVIGLLFALTLFGAPGTVMYFVHCAKKTKNIFIAGFNAILMLFLYMVLGWVLGFLLWLLFALIAMLFVAGIVIGGAAFATGAAGSGGSGWKCPKCGAFSAHESSCPRCG
ncbi:MAG: DUF6273 domain-containing protein [Clostridiales bacterium]|jgi:hypothetical protein|nr:DUF6273 domain-containing protein [Clostridiales bacterium]